MIHAREDYNRIQDPAGKIPFNEPVFLIRGQDSVGAEVVKHWAERSAEHGASEEIVTAALAHAHRMEMWPKKKTADMPEPNSSPDPVASAPMTLDDRIDAMIAAAVPPGCCVSETAVEQLRPMLRHLVSHLQGVAPAEPEPERERYWSWRPSHCVQCGRRMPAGQTQHCTSELGGYCSWFVPHALGERLTIATKLLEELYHSREMALYIDPDGTYGKRVLAYLKPEGE